MAKPPIEYRPTNIAPAQKILDALEEYKRRERAKVLARVKKHRAKKAGKK